MNKMIYAPNPVPDIGGVRVFLAGSIEMGTAEDWQDRVSKELAKNPNLDQILNPRRTDWDSSWVQSITNPNFKEQVEWEHEGIFSSDIVFFYFDPATKSPITLMELGIIMGLNLSLALPYVVVCCPDGFWRRGNIEIVCNKLEIPLYNCLEDAILDANVKVNEASENSYR